MVVAPLPEPFENVPGCATILFCENIVSSEIGEKGTLKDAYVTVRMFQRTDRKGEYVSVVELISGKNSFQFENVDVEAISRPELNVIVVQLVEDEGIKQIKMMTKTEDQFQRLFKALDNSFVGKANQALPPGSSIAVKAKGAGKGGAKAAGAAAPKAGAAKAAGAAAPKAGAPKAKAKAPAAVDLKKK